MSDKKPWDLTSTHSLIGAAEWIRKRASVHGNRAYVVVVIRATDVVYSVDASVSPAQLRGLLEEEAPGMAEALTRQRMGKTG